MDLEALMYPLRTFINLYIALMMVFFFYAMLSPAAKFRAGRTLAGSYALCLGSLLLSAVIYDYYVAKLVVTVLVLALGLGLLYRAPFSRRVLASTFYVILLMFAEAIIAALTVLFYGFSGLSVTAQAQAVEQGFPLYMFAYTLAFGLPAFVAWQRPRGEGSINLTRFLALPFSQAVGLGALLYAMYTSARTFGPVDSAVTIVVIALSIVTDIVFLHTAVNQHFHVTVFCRSFHNFCNYMFSFQFFIIAVAVMVAACLFFDGGFERLGHVHSCLVGNAQQHPQHIGKLPGKSVGILPLLERLVAITPRHYPRHLSNFLRKHGHIRQFAEVAHTVSAYPIVNRLLRFFYSHRHHSLSLESMIIVTGPSLTSATCISAPNSPSPHGLPTAALRLSMNNL